MRSKYAVGGNAPTGGVKYAWFMYSHSSYFAEIPEEYLKDDDRNYIDLKGNIISTENRVENYYLSDFKLKWNPKNKFDNPSLPVFLRKENKNEK